MTTFVIIVAAVAVGIVVYQLVTILLLPFAAYAEIRQDDEGYNFGAQSKHAYDDDDGVDYGTPI